MSRSWPQVTSSTARRAPPGHRAEAADPATFLDLTPLSAFEGGGRLSDWRRGTEGVLETQKHGIAVTALV